MERPQDALDPQVASDPALITLIALHLEGVLLELQQDDEEDEAKTLRGRVLFLEELG